MRRTVSPLQDTDLLHNMEEATLRKLTIQVYIISPHNFCRFLFHLCVYHKSSYMFSHWDIW